MMSEILSTNKRKRMVLNLRCRTFHYVILSLIDEKPINTIDIYKKLNINKGTHRAKVLNLLRKLEDKKNIASLIDVGADTRVSIYFLTIEGKKYLELIRDVSEDKLACLIEESDSLIHNKKDRRGNNSFAHLKVKQNED